MLLPGSLATKRVSPINAKKPCLGVQQLSFPSINRILYTNIDGSVITWILDHDSVVK
jgi:hypothetical protein